MRKTPVFECITPRWTALRWHPRQQEVWACPKRFIVNPAGRRSGKTELLKRKLVRSAISETQWHDAWFVASAPTVAQAKRIYWRDLVELVPRRLVVKKNETDMIIRLYNGAEIQVMGLEKPERIEGRSLNGIGIDEYADVDPKAWPENIRPALADRHGWAQLIGVPSGRNHYWELYEYARTSGDPDWAAFTWTSEGILAPGEIESMRRALDPKTFEQEVKASFVVFEGRVYYTFDSALNVLQNDAVAYDEKKPLIVCFDFNVSPGVAAIAQEHPLFGTVIIDEVWLPSDSNSQLVAQEVLLKYRNHKGDVMLYGDATGGARGSAKVEGSDWDIIKRVMKPVFSYRLKATIPRGNPPERARVNAMCARICAASGDRRLHVLARCQHVIQDLEGVVYEDDTNEIEKKSNPTLTHISDAIGYYIVSRFPLRDTQLTVIETA